MARKVQSRRIVTAHTSSCLPGLTESGQLEPVVATRIWNYIGMLGVDRETARDLFQEATTAIWEAAATRATDDIHSYFVKTGVGGIRHWLRDRYSMIRVPGYLHDRGEATQHTKVILPLESTDRETELPQGDRPELGIDGPEDDFLEAADLAAKMEQVKALLPRLTRAERQVMIALLSGQTIKEIARRRGVLMKGVYTQRSKAIAKLRRMLIEKGERVGPITKQQPLTLNRIGQAVIEIVETARQQSDEPKAFIEIKALQTKLSHHLDCFLTTSTFWLERLMDTAPDSITLVSRNVDHRGCIHRIDLSKLRGSIMNFPSPSHGKSPN